MDQLDRTDQLGRTDQLDRPGGAGADLGADVSARLRAMSRATRLIRQHRSQGGVPAGLLGILMEIDRLGRAGTGCHAKQLAAEAVLDQSTVSRAVTTLVTHGLVERRVDPADRRASILAVTPAGAAALAEAEQWYDALLRRVFAAWEPRDATAFLDALGRFAADIEGALAPPVHPVPRTEPTTHLEAAR